MRRSVIPVILSGGAGTRLWPLSVGSRPKQFLPLVTSNSLFQDTVLRLKALPDVAAPVVVCNETHRFLVAEQLREIETAAQAIVLEPKGRNTAPAIAVAALLAERSAAGDEDPVLLVLPADHSIQEPDALAEALEIAIACAEAGRLVTFGVVPTRPETGYGYILSGRDRGGWAELERFVEKPDGATAVAYLESGRYLWNSGMFVFRTSALLEELKCYRPDISAACEGAVAGAAVDADFTRLGEAFELCKEGSIDREVMEKTQRAAVVPLDAGWSDVGSWPALREVLPQDADGNVVRGAVVAVGCRNSYVSSTDRLVATLGLSDCIVIETPDAVLVMAADRAQDLNELAQRVKQLPATDL